MQGRFFISVTSCDGNITRDLKNYTIINFLFETLVLAEKEN